jgi:hypothetical protein
MPKDDAFKKGHGPQLPEALPMSFKLADLTVGKPDPRGRIVRDVLWSLDGFKIYKTDQGISPFFSDNQDLAAIQRLRYLELADIADFNHLVNAVQPWHIPFTNIPILRRGAVHSSQVQYERELARCLAQALLGHGDTANEALATLGNRLAHRISNGARVWHLFINVLLVSLLTVGAFFFVTSGYQPKFGFSADNVREIGLTVMMGGVGALFSTTVRLQSMQVDATVPLYMHWVYATQRVIVGALGALILYFAFKSGVVTALIEPATGGITAETKFSPFWLSFMAVLAGFSERLVPNLLNSKAEASEPSPPPSAT